MVGLTWLTMGATAMWILSYCLAVLLALGACDEATVYAYSPGSNGGRPGPNNPSKNTVYRAAVKGGYDTGSYSSQAGSSGILMTVEKTSSDSSSRSQLQGSGVVAGSGSLVYGTVGNAVNTPSTNVQGSEDISSSSVLMPLQQSSYSIPKPVLLTAQVQTVPQSNSQQPASSGTMAQSSGQQLPQPSFQSAVHASRRPLRGKHHQSGSNIVLVSRPVQNLIFNSLKPLKPKESASLPSLPTLQYGSVPSSLGVASYDFVSQPSGQTVTEPSDVQPPPVIDESVVQPSTQLVQQAVDTSVAQASTQQLVQTSQSVTQLSGQKPVHGSYAFMALPSGLNLLKPQKGKHHFGSKLPSSTSTPHTPSFNFVEQSTSQIPVQTSHRSEAQSASHKPGQTSYPSVPQVVDQPAQINYQAVSQPSVPQPVQPSFQSVAEPTVQQAAQASYQFVAEPSVQQPAKVSFSVAPPALQPAQPNYQWVAQLGPQQPAHVSLSVAQPISQQAGKSTNEYVVERSEQPLFKPVQSHGVHQIGTKLYSCQELPHHSYPWRYQSPPRTSHPALAQHTKPVDQSSDQTPVKPNHPRPLTSTLQSVLTPAQVPSSQQSLSRPSYTTQALLAEPMYQPLAPSSSETISLAEYHISPVSEQYFFMPPMLPSGQSLSQSSYQPLVQSSYETVLQPGFQTSSVLVPSTYQSTSSQAWRGPVVSNHESVFQSVEPELPVPLEVDYQSVTGQNAPGPAQNSRPSSQKLFRLLQQVKS